MANNKKNILIDGRFIGVGESISRYTLEILKGILDLDKINEYTVLIRPQGLGEAKKLKEKYSKLKIEVLDVKHYSFAEQTQLLKWLNQKKFDLVHFTQFNHPINYKGKFIVTVHDLTLLGHLYRMNLLKRLGFRSVMASAVKNSIIIISDSNTTKKDIIETYKADLDKIIVTHLGVDSAFNAQVKSEKLKVKSFKKKYGITGEYILYTGMWKRHKNLLQMLKAFEQVKSEIRNPKSEHIQLVLVGKIDKEEPEVIAEINRINSSLEAKSNQLKVIVTTGFIEEDELPIAYAGALAYCIPSLSEGFGLPPLEAMACGTPVISSNISAMPEILGNVPLYFDPYNVEDIAHAMKKIIEDKKLREELSKKGLEQVKKYNWKNTAKRTLDVYKGVLK